MTTGEKVKYLRRKLHLSQSQLAVRMGCKQAYISQIERGVFKQNDKTMQKLAKALHTTVTSLMNDDEIKPNGGVLTKYHRTLIRTAINRRIQQEAEALADGMGLTVQEVMRVYREECEK